MCGADLLSIKTQQRYICVVWFDAHALRRFIAPWESEKSRQERIVRRRYLGGHTNLEYLRHPILLCRASFRSHQGEREKNEY